MAIKNAIKTRIQGKSKKKLFLWTAIPLTLATLLIFFLYSFLPLSREEMKQSVAIVECQSYYELTCKGKNLVFFNGLNEDSTFLNPTTQKNSTDKHIETMTGCWVNRISFLPSCRGLLLTTIPFINEPRIDYNSKNKIKHLFYKELNSLKTKWKNLNAQISDLNYYMSTHNIQDEGYIPVAQHAEKSKAERTMTQNLITLLKQANPNKIELTRTLKVKVIYKDGDNVMREKTCHILGDNPNLGFMLVRTDGEDTPDNVRSLFFYNLLAWKGHDGEKIFSPGYSGLVINGFSTKKTRIILSAGMLKKDKQSNLVHDIPSILSQDGAPIFGEYGQFLGISYKGKLFSPSQFGFAFNRLTK